MAKKVSFNDIPDKNTDWGLDESNGFPYSGQSVQKYIKGALDGKAGVFYLDDVSKCYLIFADEASKEAYLADPKKTELLLGVISGGISEEFLNVKLQGYQPLLSTTNKLPYSLISGTPDLSVYAKTSDIPSLAGYATQTWVEGKGYLLATTASSTYQPKITSSNKLAYSLISGTPDLSVYFLKSSFTKANIKTTLGIYDWALASAKPSYKYSEISNTPDLSVYALNTDLAKKWTQNDAKIANWDSAYSWGNHANAGYAKASDVTNEFKNYVKLAGNAQSITAQHDFANGLKIGGVALRKVDNYLYLDSSLVLSGGVTMYGDDGTTVKPIWESIPLDESTLAWLDGKLSVIGGVGSGGGISEEFLNVKLQGYQPLLSTTNKLPYSLISGTPDLSVYFLKSSFTKANIKTTLGISDWALASAKPTYTASEVGALGVNGTAQSALKMTPEYLTDLNNATPWRFFDMNTGYGSTDGNKPNIAWVSGITGTASGSINYRWQLAMTTGSQNPYFRREHNGNWNNWSTLAFTSDIPTKLSQLTDDVVAGKYLSLSGGTINGSITATSFIGNLTGNAVSATSATTATKTGNGSILIYPENSNEINFGGTGSDTYIHIGYRQKGNRPVPSQYIFGSGGSADVKAKTFIGNLVGNADSAYKLVTNDGADMVHFGANTLYVGDTIHVNSQTHILGTSIRLRYGASATVGMTLTETGNVAIGGTTADAKLHVHGTAKFTDDTTFSSKVVIGTIPVYESADGTLFVDANVVFRGGVAMYGNTTTTINEE